MPKYEDCAALDLISVIVPFLDTPRTNFAIGFSSTSCIENREPSKPSELVSLSIGGGAFCIGGILTFEFEFYCGGSAKTSPV